MGMGWEELRRSVFMLLLYEHIHMGNEHTIIVEGSLALVHWQAPVRNFED